MLKTIRVNTELLESMLYFWESTRDREKVAEAFLQDLADKEEMKAIYQPDFNGESVRKVLSAITNHEVLNGASKKEMRFWNYNMYMLEDMENMRNMMAPLKVLNADSLKERLAKDISLEEVEIVFFPGHFEDSLVKGNRLYINFFMIKPDLMNPEVVTIQEKPLIDFIAEQMLKLGGDKN